MGGAAYVFVPVNVSQAFTTLVDSAYGAAVIAFFAVAVHVARHLLAGTIPWSTVWTFGATLGLVLGAKASGPLPATIGMMVTFVCLGAGAGKFPQAPEDRLARSCLWLSDLRGRLLFSLECHALLPG
ncbi:MAG: hypothetical protein HY706_07285 [Candidatus Hydrogenedentes bacterium]|nr:hypothetical protein [Candidatus Hydrogenedentota bacterium]